VLHLFFIKPLFLLLLKYAHQQQTCNVFSHSTSHGFVAQNFREIFSRRSLTHSNTWQSVGSLWIIDHANSKISAWPLTTLTLDRYICPRREPNPQSPSQRPQSYFLDRVTTGKNNFMGTRVKNISLKNSLPLVASLYYFMLLCLQFWYWTDWHINISIFRCKRNICWIFLKPPVCDTSA